MIQRLVCMQIQRRCKGNSYTTDFTHQTSAIRLHRRCTSSTSTSSTSTSSIRLHRRQTSSLTDFIDDGLHRRWASSRRTSSTVDFINGWGSGECGGRSAYVYIHTYPHMYIYISIYAYMYSTHMNISALRTYNIYIYVHI